ncbi:MAG TPA: CoA transferase [Streptosporangiaceae bacterium]|nr:CoA transferase [Streptosporangiaceae bacterium]
MTGQLRPGQLWPELLAEAWAALSADSGLAGDAGLPAGLEVLRVDGAPGRLPSRLPAEDVAIACAGAALLAAAALHAQRRDRESRGSPVAQLDREHVAAAFRSEAFLRVDGQPAGPGFAPLSRFWRAADGWVRTHGNYPWHRAALLRALGCAGDPDGDPDRVAAAIAELGARQAEDLVTGAGGVAAAVRDEASWQAEPPGQAVAATPLVEATSVGGAPPCWRPAGDLPASGIRVLDLTRVIAGPVATRYLGALGADVLRIDPPNRPELTMQTYDGLLAKRSALLDFGADGGHDRLHDLLSGADVLVHGYRPHALDRFGLDPRTLAERHPGLVVVSLSAWGSRGPWGGRRGFDSIVQAASGIARAESPDGERPGALPCQLLDHGTGYLCAAAALQALARQSARGGTQFRELSLARTAHWLLGLPRQATAVAPSGEDGEQAWLTTLDSADGPVTTVRPPGRLDDEPLAWPRSLRRYGGDAAAWPRLADPADRQGPRSGKPGRAGHSSHSQYERCQPNRSLISAASGWSPWATLVRAPGHVNEFLMQAEYPGGNGIPGHRQPDAGVTRLVTRSGDLKVSTALTTPRPKGRGFQPSRAGVPVSQPTAPGRSRSV